MAKVCIACGMPMTKDEDFAMEVSSKDYCVFCSKPDGSMQNYDEKLENMTAFIVKTQGVSFEVAQSTARSSMAKLPAWKNY